MGDFPRTRRHQTQCRSPTSVRRADSCAQVHGDRVISQFEIHWVQVLSSFLSFHCQRKWSSRRTIASWRRLCCCCCCCYCSAARRQRGVGAWVDGMMGLFPRLPTVCAPAKKNTMGRRIEQAKKEGGNVRTKNLLLCRATTSWRLRPPLLMSFWPIVWLASTAHAPPTPPSSFFPPRQKRFQCLVASALFFPVALLSNIDDV